MSSLVVSQAHPVSMLGLVVAVDGKLVTLDSAPTFVIYNTTTLPATVLQASTAGTLEGTGRYSAKVAGVAWTPAAIASQAKIVWSFTLPDGTAKTVAKTFEVVAATVGEFPEDTYALVADVKAAYSMLASSDRKIREGLIAWRDLVDDYCGQTFRHRYQTRRIKGAGGRKMFLQEPLALETLYLNNSTVAASNAWFLSYTEGVRRWNPTLEFDDYSLNSDYGGLFTRRVATDFMEGQPQKITGVWGFVDESTQQMPAAVRDAVITGCGLYLKAFEEVGGAANGAPGLVRREETDAHSIEYSVSGRLSAPGAISFLRDPAVRDLLNRYKSPIKLGWVG